MESLRPATVQDAVGSHHWVQIEHEYQKRSCEGMPDRFWPLSRGEELLMALAVHPRLRSYIQTGFLALSAYTISAASK
jgi:hypothetical protein